MTTNIRACAEAGSQAVFLCLVDHDKPLAWRRGFVLRIMRQAMRRDTE